MKTFLDKDKREWQIVVDVGQIKLVRDLVKVDLYGLFTDEAKRLFSDPPLLVDTLFVLCRAQAEARKMSDEDFGRALSDGDVLEASADALVDAVMDFFPSSRREILRVTVAKSRQLVPDLQTLAMQKINALTVTDLLSASAGALPA